MMGFMDSTHNSFDLQQLRLSRTWGDKKKSLFEDITFYKIIMTKWKYFIGESLLASGDNWVYRVTVRSKQVPALI